MTAATKLKGLSLGDGWTVTEEMSSHPSSGGMFSSPYIVEDASGTKHFLKAFDFSDAFTPGKDVLRELQMLVSAYNHERDILELCKDKRLSGVVVAVKYGYVQVPGYSLQEGTVYYLIFKMAKSDVRRQVDAINRLECMWCLRILKDVTLGLFQVHKHGIAHQDAKPSNVLVYEDGKCRVADFGRASRRGSPIWSDNIPVAGDYTYAPPELLYSHLDPDFSVRRLGCDLYLLGNLAAFLFSGINLTAQMLVHLDPQFHPNTWGGTYLQVLPHIRRVFEQVMHEVAAATDPAAREEIVAVIRELSNPDITLRGHPRGIGAHDQYTLERYVSRFNLLLQKVEFNKRMGAA